MPRPKKILNQPEDAVEEFIQGLLLQYPGSLSRIENHHVLLHNNKKWNKPSVVLFSGGGSGHEPSHAGWIGNGMLSGAICGGIFASPSVASVLAAIRSCSKLSPILLIVKNYTGDRLNFGMAAEIANQEGWDVRMVVVADDCALPRTKGITGARGLAGTVLVHKVAGAAAQAGKSVTEVEELAKEVGRRMGTIGVALENVTVPGAESVNDRLDDRTIEIGLGIHGEAGLKQSPLITANEIAREMVTKIQSHGRAKSAEDATIVPMFQPGDEVCLLVNNLGGTSNFEMSILAKACVDLVEGEEFGVHVTRLLVGSYMTSFDMHGASLTILNITDQDTIKGLLDAPTDAPAWLPVSVRPAGLRSEVIPEPVATEVAVESGALPTLAIDGFASSSRKSIASATKRLIEAEPMLTKYDTIVGDGDCGITMKRGATEVGERVNQTDPSKPHIPTDHPIPMFAGLADAVSASMGGTSGVLLELMFRKIGSTLGKFESIGLPELSEAFKAGVDAVSLYGGASVGSRTMLDALVPAAESLIQNADFSVAAQLAREGADGTASMKAASAGRSNYLSEEALEGTPDPGAIAVALVFENI